MGKNFFEEDPEFTYMRFGIAQNMNQPIKNNNIGEFFSEAHKFIDDCLEQGKNCMVHCLAGAHRAGTTGVSYVMKANDWSYRKALVHCKKIRPVVDPMGPLEDLLILLEAKLQQQETDDEQEITLNLNQNTGTLGISICGHQQSLQNDKLKEILHENLRVIVYMKTSTKQSIKFT